MRVLALLIVLAPLQLHAKEVLRIVYQHRHDASGRVQPSRSQEAEVRASLVSLLRSNNPEALRGGYFAEVKWEPDGAVWFHAWVSDARPPHAISDRAWWDAHPMEAPTDANTTLDITCRPGHGGCGTRVEHRVLPQ